MREPDSFAEFLAMPDAEREALVKTLQARSEPKPSHDTHAVDRSQQPLVQIPNLETYVPGLGCQCAAYNESECGCSADWTLTEVYELRAKLQIAMVALIRLRDCDWVISLPDRMDSVRDIAKTALEGIYHLNPVVSGQAAHDAP